MENSTNSDCNNSSRLRSSSVHLQQSIGNTEPSGSMVHLNTDPMRSKLDTRQLTRDSRHRPRRATSSGSYSSSLDDRVDDDSPPRGRCVGGSDCGNDSEHRVPGYILPPHHYYPREGYADRLFLVYVTVRYPDDYCSLSLAQLTFLEGVPEDQFLRYVNEELSQQERKELMRHEKFRLMSFRNGWPHSRNPNLTASKMAESGFYWTGFEDKVMCAFCQGSLLKWEPADLPAMEHSRNYRSICPFIRDRSQPGNIPLTMSGFEVKTISQLQKMNIKTAKLDGIDSHSVPLSDFGIVTRKAVRPDYTSTSVRLKTFKNFPQKYQSMLNAMCNAGFYWTGFEDSVRCFFCNIGLRDWSVTDDPWVEHARWSPECGYLSCTKGEDWIREVLEDTPTDRKCSKDVLRNKKTLSQKMLEEKRNMEAILSLYEYPKSLTDYTWRKDGPFREVRVWLKSIYEAIDSQPELLKHAPHDSQSVSEPEPAAAGVAARSPAPPAQPQRTTYQCYSPGCSQTSNHLVLPCGHVAYCEEHAQDELEHLEVTPCPAWGCGGPRRGLMPFYST